MTGSAMALVSRWTANFTFDRTVGSHALATAGQRERYTLRQRTERGQA